MLAMSGGVAPPAALAVAGSDANSAEADPPSPEVTARNWGIGIALRYAQIPFVGEDDSTTDLVPLLFYEGELAFLRGTEGGIRLYRDAYWRLNAYARYRFFDYPSELRDELQADRIDLGLQLRRVLPGGAALRAEALSDTEGASYLDLGAEVVFGDDNGSLRPYAGVRVKAASFNDRYFGLEIEELGGDVDWRLEIEGRRRLYRDLHLIARLGSYYLGQDTRESRLVNRDAQWEAYLGVAFFHAAPRDGRPIVGLPRYWQIASGWSAPSELSEVVSGQSDNDPYDHRLTSLFYGHPLTERLFGWPLDIYLTPGIAYHHSSEVQHSTLEWLVAVKAYYTPSWRIRTRFGLGEGFSYINDVTYIERTNLESKGYRPSRLLNFLDYSLDVNLGDLLRSRAAKKFWLGVGIHHRSGIFERSSQFGRVSGGSNYNTVYLQRHF